MPEDYEYDAFLSHSSTDKTLVREIAKELEARGVNVWFDETALDIGDNIPLGIEEGLANSRHVVLCLSPAFFSSDWVGAERTSILMDDPANRGGRLIPVMLEDCEIPSLLKPLKYADYREPDEAILNQLADRCLPSDDRETGTQEAGVHIGPDGKVDLSRPKVVRRILDLLHDPHRPGVAVLEPFGFKAGDTIKQVVDHLRATKNTLLPIQIVPDTRTDDDERLYRACERDVAFGIRQLFDYPLPPEWQEPFDRIASETDAAYRFEELVDLLQLVADQKDKRLLLVIAGLGRISAARLRDFGFFLHRVCNHGLRLLLWGREELDSLRRRTGDADFSVFHRLEPVEIQPLDEKEVSELIAAAQCPLSAGLVMEETGGHPGLVESLLGVNAPLEDNNAVRAFLRGTPQIARLKDQLEADESGAKQQLGLLSSFLEIPDESEETSEVRQLGWLGVSKIQPNRARSWTAPVMRELGK